MNRNAFGGIAFVAVCSVVACSTGQARENANQTEIVVSDTDYDDGFEIEPMSDKNIYFVPDTILADNPLFNDMVDMANGFAIMSAAYCDAELWFRFGMVVNNEIGKIRTEVIRDSVARKAAEKFVRTLVDILPRDTALWTLSDSVLTNRVWEEYTAYGDALVNRFALTRYGKLTEHEMRDYMDVRRYIENYDSVYVLRKRKSDENESLLKKMAAQTQDFDAKCLYTMEYAHQGLYDNTKHAIGMLERLMMSERNSPFLPDVWRTWRVLKQFDYGASRDSMIPNLEYNRMRHKCMNSILRQIVQHPKDMRLVANFCFLASYNNITRYGSSGYGNSLLTEEWLLFPELLEID